MASQLWQDLRQEQLHYDPSIQVSDTSLAKAIERMQEVERGYSRIFLSKVNSFSYLYIPLSAKTMEEKYKALGHQPASHLGVPIEYTPPMSPNTAAVPPKDDVTRPAMYVMFSGTGSGVAGTNALIPDLVAAGYDVYVSPSAMKFGDVSEANQRLVKVASDPNIIAHPLIIDGFARPGFGTIWDNENAGKGTNSPGHNPGDDHEMAVNAKTIAALEIGEVLAPGAIPPPEELRKSKVQIAFNAGRLKEEQLMEFGTKDGLGYIAEKVAQGPIGHSHGEVFLSEDQRATIRAEEEAVAPDVSQGSKVPFRGRYRHLDERTLGAMRSDPEDPPLTVLEYDPGMFAWGSPSAHDMVDAALSGNNNIQVTTVTSSLPESPSYPEVTYKSDLKSVPGEFDMVRMLHVGENLLEEEYEDLRNRLGEKVKEGGFFLETQRVYIPRAAEIGFQPPHHIAIYQKQGGTLVHYTDFPDGRYPKTQRELQNFHPGPERLYILDKSTTEPHKLVS